MGSICQGGGCFEAGQGQWCLGITISVASVASKTSRYQPTYLPGYLPANLIIFFVWLSGSWSVYRLACLILPAQSFICLSTYQPVYLPAWFFRFIRLVFIYPSADDRQRHLGLLRHWTDQQRRNVSIMTTWKATPCFPPRCVVRSGIKVYFFGIISA